MYIDGHEHDDVIAYHQKFMSQFLTRYAPWMYTWDNDENKESQLDLIFLMFEMVISN